jgi:CHAT domain-containing protein
MDQLASVLIDQGRYSEAESVLRASLQVRRTTGVAADSPGIATSLYHLARVISFQRRYKESEAVFAELDAAIKGWEPKRRQGFELDSSRVYQHYSSGQVEAGIKAAEALLARATSRFGDNHPSVPISRGLLAVGLARAGRQADAIREFKAAVSQFEATTREDGQEDNEFAAAARTQGMQFIVEEYIALVARMQPSESEIAETFQVADAVRAQSVQRALASSSARLVSQDAKLSVLVRKEQDLEMQVGAQTALLNNVLSLPVEERDEKAVRELSAQVAKLRVDRAAVRKDLLRSFPSYAEHVDPKPPSVGDIRAVLRPQEALLSFYFGRFRSFVWAVPKEGPVGFAPIGANAADIERLVRRLREALEPKGETVEDIPQFDIQLAHELYAKLLKPVEDSWRATNSLIVVTNGALGLLPLGLLPTKQGALTTDGGAAFAAYRNVPWLIRSHAVTSVPSAAALRTLRQLPAGKQAIERFVGFGDPLFSVAQAEEAKGGKKADVAEAVMRGAPLKRRAAPQTLGVDSADLAQLPRLPDTADELKSIASALAVDPQKALFLGRDANERKIKETDLSRFRVVAFATHGLVPGELNGLTQPALALTAPEVAGIDGDGLLTMEKVMTLKLNADWVLLSACNTGTGAGAGAEAASGLGRAFFYAGARTLLLTNWSVHSASASELVTDLFRRQAADAGLSRAEALRQAMIALMDSPGFSDPSGKILFTYAHPLFWAPYSIIGDGGGR